MVGMVSICGVKHKKRWIAINMSMVFLLHPMADLFFMLGVLLNIHSFIHSFLLTTQDIYNLVLLDRISLCLS